MDLLFSSFTHRLMLFRRTFPFTCLPCLRAKGWAFRREPGLPTPRPHKRDISRKMNLLCHRRDSQLTESVRGLDVDGQAFSAGNSPTPPKKKKKGGQREEKRQSGVDVTWHGCSSVLCGWDVTAPPLMLVSVQVVWKWMPIGPASQRRR